MRKKDMVRISFTLSWNDGRYTLQLMSHHFEADIYEDSQKKMKHNPTYFLINNIEETGGHSCFMCRFFKVAATSIIISVILKYVEMQSRY